MKDESNNGTYRMGFRDLALLTQVTRIAVSSLDSRTSFISFASGTILLSASKERSRHECRLLLRKSSATFAERKATLLPASFSQSKPFLSRQDTVHPAFFLAFFGVEC